MLEENMKTLAVIPGKTNSIHLPHGPKPPPEAHPCGGGGVGKVTRGGVDGTDKEINAAEYGAPPPGDEFLILGHESLGRVEAVGPNVCEFNPGDFFFSSVR